MWPLLGRHRSLLPCPRRGHVCRTSCAVTHPSPRPLRQTGAVSGVQPVPSECAIHGGEVTSRWGQLSAVVAPRSSERCWAREQPHIQDSAAFEPLCITRLLSQSHPGAFELGTTRLALPAFPTPGARLPEDTHGCKHPCGVSSSLHTTQKFHLKSTRSFSSSSHFFCSVVPHHLPHTTQNLSAGPRRTLLSFHVPRSGLSRNSLHLHSKSFRPKNLNCSVF